MVPLPLLVGLAMAPAVAAFARLAGFDRDRSFYPVMLINFALLYMLFAVIGGGGALLLAELPGLLAFGLVAVAGYKTSLWIVAAGLLGHGLFDAVHGSFVANPGVPLWWPAFCAGFDITAALCLALKLRRPV